MEGAAINGDFGVQYQFQENRIPYIFSRYRLGATEITRQTLRNEVRDAINDASSTRRAEDLIGTGRNAFMADVLKQVQERMGPHGIVVDNVYAVGRFRLSDSLNNAINARLQRGQETETRRQEVETARQEALKRQIEAEAEALSNRTIAESITPELLQVRAIDKWDGRLPQVMSGAVPMITIPTLPAPAAR